jgi:ABC-type branched-subunit amino acid transport system ATPase component
MMSGLNPAETSDLVDTVRSLVKNGLTLLVVEHVLRVINELADRVVVFDHGKLIAQGDPETVKQNDLVIEAYIGRRHAKD